MDFLIVVPPIRLMIRHVVQKFELLDASIKCFQPL
nr:MAG TPA: hypothetical protein [Caudoviricetes sp.]